MQPVTIPLHQRRNRNHDQVDSTVDGKSTPVNRGKMARAESLHTTQHLHTGPGIG